MSEAWIDAPAVRDFYTSGGRLNYRVIARPMSNLWRELKSRNVIRVGVAYSAVAWLVLQAADILVETLELPNVAMRIVLALLLLGFVPALVFSWLYEITPQGIRRESEIAPDDRIRPVRAGKLDRLLLWTVAGIVVLLVIDRLVLSPGDRTASSAATTSMPASARGTGQALPAKPSLAVLPFARLDASDDYFVDGITDDIITELAKLSGIFVISRNSSWTYKGTNVKVQQVGHDLDVRYVLEGSARRAGDKVRINAQLVDAVTGHNLWAEHYDGSLHDVFALQDQVIRQIVDALAVNLTHDEQAVMEQPETRNPQAYDRFLMGWALYRQGGEEENNQAIQKFEQAIELDPQYSRAHAALAAAYWRIVGSNWESATQGGFQRAYDRMQSHLAEATRRPNALAHAVAAEVLSRQGRYAEAFAEVDQAMTLAPNDADTQVSRARILNATGRAEEAEQAVRQAMRLEPFYPRDYQRVLAMSLFHQQRYEDALEILTTLISQDADSADDYVTLIAALGNLGRSEGVAEAIGQVNDFNRGIGYFSDITVQMNGLWWWYGDMFNYDPEYRDRLTLGLRKAGVPEGAGTDVPYEQYRQLISKEEGEYRIAGTTKVDFAAAKALRDRGVAFVDVRPAKDFANGHIPGAYNLDLATVLSRDSLMRVARQDHEVVISCHGKYCSDSVYASAKAVSWGFKHVYYFAGGFPAWAEAGYPVEGSPAR